MEAIFKGFVRELLARLGLRQGREAFSLRPTTLEAVRAIAQRERRPWEQVARELIRQAFLYRWIPFECQQIWDHVREREREVLELACQRLSHEEIAARLSISPLTVKKHLQRIYGLSVFAARKHDLERMFADWDWER